MTTDEVQIDSGILQFAPKGAYYEGADEQLKAVHEKWANLFMYDRTLFCLITLLAGTGYSKGVMSHMLLDMPPNPDSMGMIPSGFSLDYEKSVILYNLHKERTPRALKNLLMLTGTEGQSKVNNARARKIILEFIFNRDHRGLDNLAVNYKGKLKTLVRHALGRQDLNKILNGDVRLFNKWIGRYHTNAMPVVWYLFDRDIPTDTVVAYYPLVSRVLELKEAAIKDDVDHFKILMKGLPYLTVMGYRNTYKVTIDKADVLEASKMTTRQTVQIQSAAKRSGAKVKVNYYKQNIYDLFKLYYHKVITGDTTDLPEIAEALEYVDKNIDKIDLGDVVVILDASHSMSGSDKRPLHPLLTACTIVSHIDNIKDVISVGGTTKVIEQEDGKLAGVVLPGNETNIWEALLDAVKQGTEKIVLVSDGYENSIKGMFEHVYNHLRSEGYNFDLIHINPVMSATASAGTARRLAADVKPLPVSDAKFLETEIIFNRMIENPDIVKKLLVNKYMQLIGG